MFPVGLSEDRGQDGDFPCRHVQFHETERQAMFRTLTALLPLEEQLLRLFQFLALGVVHFGIGKIERFQRSDDHG